jgi:hypothetical protein
MFPNEALHLYDWTYTSKLSWGDFRQAKQFERSIRFAIDEQTRQLVATDQELAERGFNVLSAMSYGTERDFSIVSRDIGDLRDGLSKRLVEQI